MTNRTDILRNDITDPFAGERLKVSYFHDREKVLNLRDAWSSWNGFKFADYYYDVDYEYFCIRNTCGTYDICPMQKYLVEGGREEAIQLIQRAELLKEADLGDTPNLPSFVKKALED